jgi:hypothetical protein
MKKTQTYTELLEGSLHDLVQILTDPNLWNFLSDSERSKVSEILNRQYQQI